MDASLFQSLLEIETWISFSERFSYFGPIYGILMPMIESFFPPLPLSLFVTINVMMFGLGWGYLYSLIGTCVGSMLTYGIVNKFEKGRFNKVKEKYKIVNNASNWVKEKGGLAIFILLCFPFTPSLAVAVLAALAGMRRKTYVTALLFGKAIMVLQLSVVGYNIFAAIKHPIRLIVIVAGVFLIYTLVSKLLEKVQRLYSKKRINMD
ncbi:MAG: VTT domain-containing protein [Clostridia bacterium]|nr:VTT domain-containing protein [Clostridia bacterium]